VSPPVFGNSVSEWPGGSSSRGGGGIALDSTKDSVVRVDRDLAAAAHGGVMQRCLDMSKMTVMPAGSLAQRRACYTSLARNDRRDGEKVKKQSQP
jgi:hypothetical protein